MLRSTTEKNRLYLTADLRANDLLTLPPRDRMTPVMFAPAMKRFPPIEDVLATLERTASRVSAA
jgi:hypothetical protein